MVTALCLVGQTPEEAIVVTVVVGVSLCECVCVSQKEGIGWKCIFSIQICR